MHDTALISGEQFAAIYGSGGGKTVVDIGGSNYNGTLRAYFESKGNKYICVDIEKDKSVDLIISPGEKIPLENNSIDLVISTSCFEHDPCFWMTFKEMCRIVKRDGYIYVNAPSNGIYHAFPGDNWRFFSDAGQALAYWSGIQMVNEETHPVKVIETFTITPLKDIWEDFVCVWQRCDTKETKITRNKHLIKNIGPFEKSLNDRGLKTRKKCNSKFD
tara:strand:+ start:84 stop:734 length:651 start_codon:yes stop_codon:yes gene_type:complete